jgi:hypothetical protein
MENSEMKNFTSLTIVLIYIFRVIFYVVNCKFFRFYFLALSSPFLPPIPSPPSCRPLMSARFLCLTEKKACGVKSDVKMEVFILSVDDIICYNIIRLTPYTIILLVFSLNGEVQAYCQNLALVTVRQ